MTSNELSDDTGWPLITCRVYLPKQKGYYEYMRLISPEALESDAMLKFYKDDLWFELEKKLLEERIYDRHKKAPAEEGFVERCLRKLRG